MEGKPRKKSFGGGKRSKGVSLRLVAGGPLVPVMLTLIVCCCFGRQIVAKCSCNSPFSGWHSGYSSSVTTVVLQRLLLQLKARAAPPSPPRPCPRPCLQQTVAVLAALGRWLLLTQPVLGCRGATLQCWGCAPTGALLLCGRLSRIGKRQQTAVVHVLRCGATPGWR